jgi:MerR family transcriptional regulator, light-induced transcriptional regulator
MEKLPDPRLKDLFRESLLAGDRMASSHMVRELLEKNIPVQTVYEELIKHALYQVGELWENNRITVAEEHLATSVSEAVMNELLPYLVTKTKKKKKKAMLACVENELHQVGVKMVADVFELKGWDSFFLGSNVPIGDLVAYAGKVHPDIFALSASIYFHIPDLKSMLLDIRASFPDTPVLVGGQAFRHGGQEVIAGDPLVTLIPDLYTLESHIDQLDKQTTE